MNDDNQRARDDDGMRLLSMGPTPDGGFGINLTGGPLHAFTAYLIELMTGPDGEMWNCMETKVQAADLKGTFILTVQRADGKTPMDLRMEAEARATSAREEALREAAEKLGERAKRHEQDPVTFGGFSASRASEAWACANTILSLITGGERGADR